MVIFAFLVVLLPLNAFIFSMNTHYSNGISAHDRHFPAKSGNDFISQPSVLLHCSYEDVIRMKVISGGKRSSAIQKRLPSTSSNITQQNRTPYG